MFGEMVLELRKEVRDAFVSLLFSSPINDKSSLKVGCL